MKGMSFGNSPMKQNGDKLDKAKGKKKATMDRLVNKNKKDTRTPSQKARDKRDLERQTNIQRKFQNTETQRRRNVKNQIYELGYFQDKGGKIVHPFGKREKMDKAKWDEWKSKDENKPYKGKTKGLIN